MPPRLRPSKPKIEGRVLLLLDDEFVALPLVIRNEKWKDGTFSGWSKGVIIGYL